MSIQDEDDAVSPEMYAAMDSLYKSQDPAVKMVLLMAEQRGYSELGKFVMLAQSLYMEKERVRADLLAALLERQKEYVIVTPEQYEILTRHSQPKGVKRG